MFSTTPRLWLHYHVQQKMHIVCIWEAQGQPKGITINEDAYFCSLFDSCHMLVRLCTVPITFSGGSVCLPSSAQTAAA